MERARARRNPRGQRPTLFLDQLLPASEVAVPHSAVHVDHALLEALEEIEVERPVVPGAPGRHAEPGPEERQEVGQRVHQTVDALADAVTDRQRLEQRQDQVRAGAGAPDGPRLAEGLLALLDVPVLRGVEETADAERAVDQKPRHLAARPAPLALEQAVDR